MDMPRKETDVMFRFTVMVFIVLMVESDMLDMLPERAMRCAGVRRLLRRFCRAACWDTEVCSVSVVPNLYPVR